MSTNIHTHIHDRIQIAFLYTNPIAFDWRKILIFISIFFFHSFFFTVCGSFYCSLTRHNFYESIVCDTTGDRQQMHEQQQKQQQEQQ